MSIPEKLLYLQNGVFKRKEMSNGIQYYSNNSFGTFALPSANGNYVLTNTNNVFTWTDAGDVSTGGMILSHSLLLITRTSKDPMDKR